MNKEIVGILFISMDTISICMAALQQMYVMMTEICTLNRFEDKGLVRCVVLLLISFDLAVYLLCPSPHKKDVVFFILGDGDAIVCLLTRIWLPSNR